MATSVDLNEILSRLDIKPFIQQLGLEVKKDRAGKLYCNCPFCGGDEKLSVTAAGDKKGLWKCFKCNETGNQITLYAKLNNCKNGDAVKAIKKFIGIEDEYQPTSKLKSTPKVKKTDVPAKVDAAKAPEQSGQSDADRPSEETARGPARARDIYATLVKVAALTDAHRQELRSKRGFTNDLIDRLSFRSGGPYMMEVVEQLRAQFSDDDLKEAGILVDVHRTLIVNEQLLENNVLIPYLDENGNVYHLRPHKLGFKDVPPEPYARQFLKDCPSEIILTEGEFKAAALAQMGIPAVAIPGISSFAKKHYDRLVEMLSDFGIKRVNIIFDNEVKDNPEFPNYKERPEDRFDTDYWAYMMAWKLGKSDFTTRIGKLPDEWRVKGKIDFDGALATGHTAAEILKVISQAVPPKEFLDSLSEDAQRVVKRKIAKEFARLPIRREFNKYVVTRNKSGNSWEETISNFIINIKSSFFTPDGVVRNIQLVNEYGEASDIFPLDPSDMSGLDSWKKFCFSKGNYIFEGNSQDLMMIWKLEFLRDIGDLVFMPDRIGRIEGNLWLFGNLAIKNGQVFRPDNDGIIWIHGKGYKPQSIQIGARGEAVEDAIPALKEKPVDLVDLAQKMKNAVGGYEAYMGIGWAIATIFSQDIFEQYKCVPILFPHGKRESGKSTFMRWIMAFFGVENDGVGIAETTQNYIARSLAYFSSLGCWFDEYRNEQKVIQKDGFFRSAYNRQMSGKGTATSFQTKAFSVNAAVAISGEELPKDNGLFTRLIPLQISEYKRDRTWFEWIQRHTGDFSYLTYYLVMHYDELKPKIMANIAELKKALLAKDISDRAAENWAICAGCFDTVIVQDDGYIEWVEQACQEIKRTGETEHMLNQFLGDISVLVSEGKLNGSHLQQTDKDTLAIWLNGVYGVWSIYYRSKTGREPFDEMSIRKYLMEEPYYIDSDRIRFLDGRRRAFLIDINKAPESIQEACDCLTSRKWTPGTPGNPNYDEGY